jgi:nucleoside-diphosphate-sugar epimerase
MRIAITGAAWRLGRALRELANGYELRLTDLAGLAAVGLDGTEGIQVVEGDLREPEVARRVVAGCGVVIHLAAHPESWPADLAESEALDRCARGTFELLRAAVAAGVPRVVLASTLDPFEPYPAGWAVNEGWRPRPQPAIRELGPYLAELSAREFARAGWPLLVVCLRLGRLVGGAAVAHGIRRVVHTGPQILSHDHPAGYGTDFGVPDDVPPRAGANVYFHSKYLGLEVCRVFAENHGLEVLALLFSQFVNPAQPGHARGALGPAAISWADAGRALERALDVPSPPSPFEVVRMLGDLPNGMFANDKARRVLGWTPEDSLLPLWQAAAEAR